MKLLAIRGGNLASLAEPFDIDFTTGALAASGLFVVTGPTGAGKSTLLDALCLALYGALPRLSEAGKSAVGLEPGMTASDPRGALRQGAGEGFAEVDFLGRDLTGKSKRRAYRARCEIRRARGKAEGALQSLKMRLFDLETGAPISDKINETKSAIADRIGLSFDQFKRSALLAQGDFEAFLAADPKDRALLLERITGAEIFGRVSQAAHQRKRDEEQAIAALEKQTEAHRPLSKDERAAAEKRAAEAKRKAAAAVARREALAAIGRYAETAAALRREREAAVERARVAATAFERTVATAAARLQRLAAETQRERETLEREQAERPWAARLADRQDEAEAALERAAACAGAIRELEQRRAALGSAISTVEQKLGDFDAEAKTRNAAMAPKRDAAQQARAAVAALEPERIEAAASAGRETRRILSSVAAPLAEWRLSGEALAATRAKEIEARNSADAARAQLAEIDAATPTLRAKAAAAQEKLETWRAALSEHAEALRATLKEGEPCPVCGARDHAASALTQAASAAASDEKARLAAATEELDALIQRRGAAIGLAETSATMARTSKMEREEAARRRAASKRNAQAALAPLDGVAARLAAPSLADAARALSAQLDEDKVGSALAKHAALVDAAKIRLDEIDAASDALAAARAAAETQEAALRAEERRMHQLSERIETARAARETRRSELAETEARLTAEREAQAGAAATLDRVLEGLCEDWRGGSAKETRTLIRREADAARTRRARMLQLAEAAPRIETEQSALAELTLRRPPTNPTDCTPPPEQERAGLAEASSAADALARAESRAENAAIALERHLSQSPTGATPYLDSPASLQKAREEIQTVVRSTGDAWETASLALREDDAVRARLGATEKALAQKREEADVWLKLDALIGSADGSKFRKFAQSLTLQSLAALASRRLKHLAPRYALEVAAGDPTDPDLSLIAVDRDMGDARRPVRQLSGGERFLTALALALALSDLSSEQGVVVDSLFIDEGFGALDVDSLGMALSALEALQATGRQIGVVTHVEAMSERIATRIEVAPLGGGRSRIRVEGPR